MTDMELVKRFSAKYKDRLLEWRNDVPKLRWKIVQEFNVDFHTAMRLVGQVKMYIAFITTPGTKTYDEWNS